MRPFDLAILTLALTACHHHRPVAAPPGLALDTTRVTPPVTLVWVGHGEAERLDGGTWRRAPEFDYAFTVEQRRFADHWESVKTLRRLHPHYDGSAGPRVQVYTFRLEVAPDGGGVRYAIASSLGSGHGRGDREFREATLELRPGGDWLTRRFRPFDRYRITQHYLYEEGLLTEVVELADGSRPWVRNHERAALFGERSFEGPPTRL